MKNLQQQYRSLGPVNGRLAIERIQATVKNTNTQIKQLQSSISQYVAATSNMQPKNMPASSLAATLAAGSGAIDSKDLPDMNSLMLRDAPGNQSQGSRLNQWMKDTSQQQTPASDKGV